MNDEAVMNAATGQRGRGRRTSGRGGALIAALLVVLVGIAAILYAGTRMTSRPTAQWMPPGLPLPTPVAAAPSAAQVDPVDGTDEFTLSAVGDTILGAAPSGLPPNNGAGFFSDVESALHSDLQMANLEQPLTDDTGVSKCGAEAGKTCFQFRAPPSYAKVLKNAGFGLVTIANNHAYDFGAAGHQNTRAALDAVGIKYTGPPGMITKVTVKGVRVAVLGFAPYPWANNPDDIPGSAALVKQARADADVVIVQVHMGGEGADHTHVKPGTEMFLGENRGDPIAFSHAMIDAGASIVIGHSPHVLRAMEFYKGHLIAYSLGNFAGYKALGYSGVPGITAILRVTLRKDGSYVGGTVVPTHMVAPGLPRLDPGRQAISMINSLSRSDFPKTGAKLGTDGKIGAPST